MKKFFSEFKQFAMRGNVVDLAVGVIIGAAFKTIVDSLVNDIISPLLGLLVNTNFSELSAEIGGVTVAYGSFITAVLNFVLMAFVLFLLVKAMNRLSGLGKKKQPEQPPLTKVCPFCKSEIAAGATRCPNCTSQLDDANCAK